MASEKTKYNRLPENCSEHCFCGEEKGQYTGCCFCGVSKNDPRVKPRKPRPPIKFKESPSLSQEDIKKYFTFTATWAPTAGQKAFYEDVVPNPIELSCDDDGTEEIND